MGLLSLLTLESVMGKSGGQSLGTIVTQNVSTVTYNTLVNNYVPLLNQSVVTNITNAPNYLQNGLFVVSSSYTDFGYQFFNYQAFAFSAANANYWACNSHSSTTTVDGTSKTGEWLQIKIPVQMNMTSFTTCNVYNSPGAILIAGSTDGTTWTTVYNITSTGLSNTNSATTFGAPVVFNVTGNSNFYNYFRFIVTTPGGQTNLAKVNFSGSILSSSNVIISGTTLVNNVTYNVYAFQPDISPSITNSVAPYTLNYTLASSTFPVYVMAVGGGGGGGSVGGGGGGAGGVVMKAITLPAGTDVININIGAGGCGAKVNNYPLSKTLVDEYYSTPALNQISSAAYNSCQGAYGCILLNSNYTGPILQLRSPSDTTGTSLTNFYSDIYGNLTTGTSGTGTAVTAWSSNINYAYVATWYDQSNITTNNAIQTVVSSQPVYDIANKIINFGYTGSSSGTFSVASINGLILWLDAADPNNNGTQPANNANVTAWKDKSGLGNNAAASSGVTYTTAGLNSKPAFYYNNGNQGSISYYFSGNVTNNNPTMSVFAVISMSSASLPSARIIGFSGGSTVNDFQSTNYFGFLRQSSTGMGPYRAGVYVANNTYTSYATPYVYGAWFDGTNEYSNVQVGNNTAIGSAASSGNFAITYYSIGNNPQPDSNGPFTGYISEIIVYNTSLTTTQRQQIEGYLSWKWGLQANLPTSHPYYSASPSGSGGSSNGSYSNLVQMSPIPNGAGGTIDINSTYTARTDTSSTNTVANTAVGYTYANGTYYTLDSGAYGGGYYSYFPFNNYNNNGDPSWSSSNNWSGGTNNNFSTVTNIGTLYGPWIHMQLPYTSYLASYAIRTRGADGVPKDFYVAGSIDGSTWTVIDTQTNAIATTSTTTYNSFTTPTVAYNYYRLIITKNNGNTYSSLIRFDLNGYLNYTASVITNTGYITNYNANANLILPNSALPYNNTSYTYVLKHWNITAKKNWATFVGGGSNVANNGFALEYGQNTGSNLYDTEWYTTQSSNIGTVASNNIVSSTYTSGVSGAMYINGTQTTWSVTGRQQTNTGNMIGGWTAGGNGYLNSQMYYLYVFGSALSNQDRQIVEGTIPTTNYNTLLSYFKLDEAAAATTVVDSISGYNGTSQNSVSFGNLGIIGNSASFNGTNQWISIPYQVLNNLSSGTIMCWIYPKSIINATICAKQRDGQNTIAALMIGSYANTSGILITGSPGTVYFHSTNTQVIASSVSAVPINSWSHIAVTFTTTQVNIYINGVLNSTTSTNGSIPAETSSTSCAIGAWYANSSVVSAFTGFIDDFSVWCSALSDTTINKVYSSQISCIPNSGTNTTVSFNAEPISNITAFGGGAGGIGVVQFYPKSGGSGGGIGNFDGSGGMNYTTYTGNFSNCILYFPFDQDVNNYSTGTGVSVGSIIGTGCQITNSFSTVGTGCLQSANINSLTSYFKITTIAANVNGYTFSCWLYVSSAAVGMVWSFSQNSANTNRIYLYYNGTQLCIGTASGNLAFFTPTLYMWYHFAWTLDKSNNSIVYINGSSVFSTTSYAYLSYVFDKNYILSDPNGAGGSGMYGYIDDFYYFDTVMTATNIVFIYNTSSQNMINSANIGGSHTAGGYGAGGGGAGSAGTSSTSATSIPNGGIGIQSTLAPISAFSPLGTNYGTYYWGGGGGGGSQGNQSGGTSLNGGGGGFGGGGGGASAYSTITYPGGSGGGNSIVSGSAGNYNDGSAGNAGANTGGGGGGAWNSTGGNGGSGIAVIAIPVSVAKFVPGVFQQSTAVNFMPIGIYSFAYTGYDQALTVPDGTTYMTVKVWGAGGGIAGIGGATTYRWGGGGSGGYTSASFNVTAGQTLKIIVGKGGIYGSVRYCVPNTYGGGGGACPVNNDTNWGTASGGGRTAVQLLVSSTYTELITAGGGGAGGETQWNDSSASHCAGGAGGGTTGGNGYGDSGESGSGGTQSAGGAAAVTVQAGSNQAGSQYTGGYGTQYGGGGGGGWYGGGGGGSWNGHGWLMGGGGGGSSYVNTAYQYSGSTNVINQGVQGIYNTLPAVANNSDLPTYVQGMIGYGGKATGQTGNDTLFYGGDGYALVTFYAISNPTSITAISNITITNFQLNDTTGSATTNGNIYTAYVLKSTGITYTITYTSAIATTIYLFAVGGGGGAGQGGGGAGGVFSDGIPVVAGTGTITITIGSGGAGVSGSNYSGTATAGGNTTVTFSGTAASKTVTVWGGGYGANWGGTGGTGGSGGAGEPIGGGAANNAGNIIGWRGGMMGSDYNGGGGGGAGGPGGFGGWGSASVNNGFGGIGIRCLLPGLVNYQLNSQNVSYWYWAGGGAGTGANSFPGGYGGLGGGGGGSCSVTGYSGGLGGGQAINSGGNADNSDNPGSAGANTGGGGGGSRNKVGGSGGSGIVIIALPTSIASFTTSVQKLTLTGTNYKDTTDHPYSNMVIINYQAADLVGTSTANGITYMICAFTTPNIAYTINYTCNESMPIQIFAVGGGGGGSNWTGGGGGGGGVVMQYVTLPNGSNSISISVGAGGSGPTSSTTLGSNGSNSTVTFNAQSASNITAYGGGRGAGASTIVAALTGGSGGGSSGYTIGTGVAATGNTASNNLANSGGTGVYVDSGTAVSGGGGGAGAAAVSKNGGNGIKCSMPGINAFTPYGVLYGNYYWGGGGGGCTSSTNVNEGNGGAGGKGGGGGGNIASITGKVIYGGLGDTNGINAGTNASNIDNGSAGNGGVNTGGGGGGGWSPSTGTGGAGGSGIVIIAFPNSFTVDWKPNYNPGLALWFDASDNSSIVQTGGKVSQWNDKSPNQYSVIQPISGNQPTYVLNSLDTKPGVQLSTTSWLYQYGNTIGNYSGSLYSTVYILIKNSASLPSGGWNVLNTMWFNGINLGISRYHLSLAQGSTNGVTLYADYVNNGSNGYVGQIGTVPFNGYAIIGFTVSPYATTISLNGTSTTFSGLTLINANSTNTMFNFGDFRQALVQTSNEIIYEFIGYNIPLSTTQSQAVEGYLAWKWNLQSYLPSSHPYFNIFPVQTTWSPSSVSSTMLLWLDASDSNTVIKSGSSVVQWSDKSGGGNHMTQSIVANQPTIMSAVLNGLNVINFGITSFMQNTGITLPRAYTIFGVGYTSANSTLANNCYTRMVSSIVDASLFFGALDNINADFTGNGTWNDAAFNYPYVNVDSWSIKGMTNTGAGTGQTSYVNGTPQIAKTGNNVATTGLYLGCWTNCQFWNGPMAEILIYNGVLSTNDRQAVEGYLAWKWGVQGYLPTGHPYQFLPINTTSTVNNTITGTESKLFPTTNLMFDFYAGNGCNVNSNGGTLTIWNDQMKNIVATGNATFNKSIQNGLPMISGGLITTSSFGSGIMYNWTHFLVCNTGVTGNTTGELFLQNTVTNGIQTGISASNFYTAMFKNNGNAAISSNVSLLPNKTYILTISYSLSGTIETYTYRTNGVNTTPTINYVTAAYNYVNGSYIVTKSSTSGAAPSATGGYVGEQLLYNSTVSVSQIQKIEQHLAWKWGISMNGLFNSIVSKSVITTVPSGSLSTGNGIISGTSTDGGKTYNVYVFGLSSYVLNCTVNSSATCYILAVGGGGGAGTDGLRGAGGGGGGVYTGSVSLSTGTGSITINVGSGGTTGSGLSSGYPGNNSTVSFTTIATTTITAYGGGGNGATNSRVGGNSGAPTANNGGTNNSNCGGSGGGAGAAAANSNGDYTGVPGGIGLTVPSLTGISTFTLLGNPVSSYYWGGGGGNSAAYNAGGVGGLGGGGSGGGATSGGGGGITPGGTNGAGANTGGGGGAANAITSNGGSGIVIIAIPTNVTVTISSTLPTTNLLFDFYAGSGTNITTNGGTVTSWTDAIKGVVAAGSGTYNTSLQNNLPMISSGVLTTPSIGSGNVDNWTHFVVYKFGTTTAAASGQGIFENNANYGIQIGINGNYSACYNHIAWAPITSTATFVANGIYILVISYSFSGSTGTYVYRTNGVDTTQSPGYATTSNRYVAGSYIVSLGSYSGTTPQTNGGFIGEQILYNTTLSLSQIKSIEQYLSWKWSIPIGSPAATITASPETITYDVGQKLIVPDCSPFSTTIAPTLGQNILTNTFSLYISNSAYLTVTTLANGANDLTVYGMSVGTVEVWVNFSQSTTWAGIVVKANYYGLYISSNKFTVYSWSTQGNTASTVAGNTLNDGAWHHLAFSFNSGVTNGSFMYVDGVLVGTLTWYGNNNTTNAFCVGSESANYNPYTGYVEELRIWNIQLTAAFISANYKRKVVPSAQGLVGYFTFDTDSYVVGSITAGTIFSNNANKPITNLTAYGTGLSLSTTINANISNYYKTFTASTTSKYGLPIGLTNNLVAFIDFSNTSSYSGSGNTFYNLVDKSAQQVLGGQNISFSNGLLTVNSSGSTTYLLLASYSIKTISIWLKLNASTGYILDGRTVMPSGWIYQYTPGSNWIKSYKNGGSLVNNPTQNDMYDITGTLYNITVIADAVYTEQMIIGARYSLSEGLNCSIAKILVFNTELSQADNNTLYNTIISSSFNSNNSNSGTASGSVYVSNIPNFSGMPALWAAYSAEKWNSTTNILPDLTSNARDATTSGVTLGSATGNGATGTISYLDGNTGSKIIWPAGSIPSTFTICSLTRYTGGTNGRIFDSAGNNWLHGHWGGRVGVCHYDGWRTPTETVSSVSNVSNWLICTGTNSANVSTPNNVIVNGTGVGNTNGGTGNLKLTIGSGSYGGENSTFQFSQLFIWDSALTAAQMLVANNFMQNYLNSGSSVSIASYGASILSDSVLSNIYPSSLGCIFRIKSFTSSVPTADVDNVFALNNTGSVTCVPDPLNVRGGYVFQFNGSNYLSISVNTPAISTKTFWVYTTTPSTGNGYVFSSTNYPVNFKATNYLSARPNFLTVVASNPSSVSQPASWTFYAITCTPSSVNIYMNGSSTPVATNSLTNFTGDTTDVQFGAYTGTGSYTGYLDDMRLYPAVLTPDQMYAIFIGDISVLNNISSNAYSLSNCIYGTHLLNTNYTGPIMQLRLPTDSTGVGATDFFSDIYGNLNTRPNNSGMSLSTWSSLSTFLNNDPALLMYYPFDSNLFNIASGSADATFVNGGYISNNDYKVGYGSCQFVGYQQYVNSSASFTTGTNGISFSFWFRSNNSPNYAILFNFSTSYRNNTIFMGISNANQLGCSVYNGTSTGDVWNPGTTNVNDNVWRHCLWTINNAASNNSTIYLNGVVSATFTINYPQSVVRSVNYFGYNEYSNGLFNGAIDDFRVYNRAINSAPTFIQEISLLYNYTASKYAYVTKWYDQSNQQANTAYQTAVGSQPIYDIENNIINFGYSGSTGYGLGYVGNYNSNAYLNLYNGALPYNDTSYTYSTRLLNSNNSSNAVIVSGGNSATAAGLHLLYNYPYYNQEWYSNGNLGLLPVAAFNNIPVTFRYLTTSNTATNYLYVNANNTTTSVLPTVARSQTNTNNSIGTNIISGWGTQYWTSLNSQMYYLYALSLNMVDNDRYVLENTVNPNPVNTPYLLNNLSNTGYNSCQGVYACLLVNTQYKGPVMQLRSPSDTAGTNLIDFYSDIYGNLTTLSNGQGIAVAAWSSNINYAYVTKWYDQSNVTTNHATQTTTGSQPVYDIAFRVINFGYTGASGGYVANYNSNAFFNLPNAAIPYGDSSYSIVLKHWNIPTNGNFGFLNGGLNNSTSNCLCIRTNTNAYFEYWGSTSNMAVSSTIIPQNVISTTYVSGSSKQPFYVNSTLITTGTMPSPRTQISTSNFIGVTNTTTTSPGSEYLNGQIYYLCVFNTSLSNSDRNLIENVGYFPTNPNKMSVAVNNYIFAYPAQTTNLNTYYTASLPGWKIGGSGGFVVANGSAWSFNTNANFTQFFISQSPVNAYISQNVYLNTGTTYVLTFYGSSRPNTFTSNVTVWITLNGYQIFTQIFTSGTNTWTVYTSNQFTMNYNGYYNLAIYFNAASTGDTSVGISNIAIKTTNIPSVTSATATTTSSSVTVTVSGTNLAFLQWKNNTTNTTNLVTCSSDVTSGLNNYYKFNAADQVGSTVYDYAASTYTATLPAGSTISTTQSKFGGASLFVSSGNGCTLPAYAFNGTTGMTIAFWSYITAYSAGQPPFCLKYTAAATIASNYGQVLRPWFSSATRFYIDTDNIDMPIDGISVTILNNWVHQAYVISGTGLSLYINGTLYGSMTFHTALQNLTYASFTIGSDINYNGTLTGYFDEFRVYNRQLNSTEVSTIYNSNSGSFTDNTSIAGGTGYTYTITPLNSISLPGTNYTTSTFTTLSAYYSGLVYTIYNSYKNNDTSASGWVVYDRGNLYNGGSATGRSANLTNIGWGTNGAMIGNWGGNSYWNGNAVNGDRHDFTIVWYGLFYTQSYGGNWTFGCNSDDASFLWIGNNASGTNYTGGRSTATVDDGDPHGMRAASTQVSLTAYTYYPFRVQFGEAGGGYESVITVTRPDGTTFTDGAGYYFSL